ncbi:cytochrome P450 2K6-like [Protopterus annectens]|uniref:cytochrome P450 2K6-like n=1 Tax=Protopterus annectens TaxID=7888 RepID=UPI001CFB5822|nr:cytochrome P450 2K6-like [Protopterus annectens]
MVNMTTFYTSLLNSNAAQLLCVSLLLLLVLYVSLTWTPSPFKLPPGPIPLPIIGNLHILNLKQLDESLIKLSEKYGNVFTIQLGPRKAIVLVGYDVVQDALVNHAEAFGERAKEPMFECTSRGKGIIFGHGESWKTMRRFALSTMRDFGMGKKNIEDRIHQEAQMLIRYFESHKGQPFCPKGIMNRCTANVICSIVLGKRFDYEDPAFIKLTRQVTEGVENLITPLLMLYNFFPKLGFLLGAHKTVMRIVKEQEEYFSEFIKSSRQTMDENDIRSFVDAFMLKQQEENKKTHTYFTDENLLVSTWNLFGAGTETSSTTLLWAFLLMMKYPEIQKKVQEEIDEVVGSERLPKLEDKVNLPYCDAVIHETQRFGNITPLPVGRATTYDTHFRGYFIPKDTNVLPVLTSVLYDKTQWETPYRFTPSHFLDANGKFVKRAAFIPFLAGRRSCLGGSLAKAELFLFFTAVMQKFTFCPSPGVTSEDLELLPEVGVTLCPKPYLLCAVPRK